MQQNPPLSTEEKRAIAAWMLKPEFSLVERLILWKIGVLTDQAMMTEKDDITLKRKYAVAGIKDVIKTFKDVWDEVQRLEQDRILKKPEKKAEVHRIFGPEKP